MNIESTNNKSSQQSSGMVGVADVSNILSVNRIQRKRTKGFKTPKNTVYVGRPTKFGNPFRLTPDGWIQYHKVGKIIGSAWCYWSVSNGFTLKDIVELYEQWIKGELKHNGLPTPPDISNLKGKNLSCFCSLQSPCHADILLKLSNCNSC